MLRTLLTGLIVTVSAGAEAASEPDNPSLIPWPSAIERGAGFLVIDPDATADVVVRMPSGDKLRQRLQWVLSQVTVHREVSFDIDAGPAESSTIIFRRISSGQLRGLTTKARLDLPDRSLEEAYHLRVGAERVIVEAATDAGLFYGAVTLWQLLTESNERPIRLAQMDVVDAPRFGWRGLMLDSARHMQPVAFIKRYLDWMALHKLNTFHWHLTDDQAWRLEILRYPRLTDVGAWRVPAGEAPAKDIDPATGNPRLYGGFYGQDEVREIVTHAAARHITVVPEIDVPGHATAAIAAYPELGVEGHGITAPGSSWGVYHNVFNINESTFEFLEGVLDEVMDLFPGPYIHLGGDEAVKQQWQDSDQVRQRMKELGFESLDEVQNLFVRRLQSKLASRDRRIIGWDEILEGDLPEGSIVMSWRGIAGAIEAARHGLDTVLSPAPTLYLDHIQTDAADAPPGRGGVIGLPEIYGFDPLPEELAHPERVLGIQGNLWTEHVRTTERVEAMTYPRAAAIAELGWSQKRSFEDFERSLARHLRRFHALGLDVDDSAFAPRLSARMAETTSFQVDLTKPAGIGEIRYTLDDTPPGPGSPRAEVELTLPYGATLTAQTFHDDYPASRPRQFALDQDLLHRREDRELTLCTENIVLAIEDDAPLRGERESFLVDIMNPCWVYPAVDLAEFDRVVVAVGQVPFNFEIGDDVHHIDLPTPAGAVGELNIHRDSCDGTLIGSASLASAQSNPAVTVLPEVILDDKFEAKHDLCFRFTRESVDPIWVIDWIQLRPRASADR